MIIIEILPDYFHSNQRASSAKREASGLNSCNRQIDYNLEIKLSEKEERNLEIRTLKRHSDLTNQQIADIFDLGTRTVERIKK